MAERLRAALLTGSTPATFLPTPPAPVELEDEPIPDGDFGDLGLVTAAVLLSVPVLRGLVARLAYRHRGTSFEQAIEIERPDGTRVRELASATGMPLDQISGPARVPSVGDRRRGSRRAQVPPPGSPSWRATTARLTFEPMCPVLASEAAAKIL